MFERYTEQARRALFFARYEASLLGSISIQTEHLLLGLLREAPGLIGGIGAQSQVPLENIRKDIEEQSMFREKVATSVEIPFSAEAKRALQSAADEADRLLHKHIGPEHMLLGLLRQESSLACEVLKKNDFELETVRRQVVELQQAPNAAEGLGHAQLAQEFDHLKRLVERLARMAPDQAAAMPLLEEIKFGLDHLRGRFGV